MKPKILVAIPVYNCEKQVPRVLAGLMNNDLSIRIHKVMVIDNQSSDQTIACAQNAIHKMDLKLKIQIVRNIANYGLGGSQKIAFLTAIREQYDYVAILHGDDQGVTDELLNLIISAESSAGCSAILGARFMPQSTLVGYSKLRIFGNIILNIAYSLFSGRITYDMGSGLNLFKVNDLDPQIFCSFDDGFTFNMDLLLSFYRRKLKLKYIPITWREFDQISNVKTFKVGWIALKTLLFWRFMNPVHISKSPEHYSYSEIN